MIAKKCLNCGCVCTKAGTTCECGGELLFLTEKNTAWQPLGLQPSKMSDEDKLKLRRVIDWQTHNDE